MPSLFQQTVADSLLANARNGESAAHAELFRLFGQPVYTLARRLLIKPELAEDVLQDTFVEVLRNLSAFRGEAPLGIWIRRIAVNHCLLHLRSPWHRLRMQLEDNDQDERAQAVANEIEALDMERALDMLSPETRAVVWLHDVEGYTHQEIGQLMNATPSYSKSQLARAYQRMRRWADHEAGERACTPVLNN